MSHRGVGLFGASIVGELDLSLAKLTFPLVLVNCNIPDGVSLIDTRLSALVLTGTRTTRLAADRLRVRGNVILDSFECRGMTQLRDGFIGGSLDCANAGFNRSQGTSAPKVGTVSMAIDAEGLEVVGDVFMRSVFTEGEVRLRRVKIGGDLLVKDAHFFIHFPEAENEIQYSIYHDVLQDKLTLNCEGIRIGQNLDCAFIVHRWRLQATARPD